jgi:cytochrome c biogenesis protein
VTDVHAPESEAAQNADQAPPPVAAGAGWLRWGWRQLTSMRTALILLFLLALGAVPGSVLPQQGSAPADVLRYYAAHPSLAPLLGHLGLFNVFAAPWFAAIYLLLFASLCGCVVPRTFKLAGEARTQPPRAPRNLKRLPHSATFQTALAPQDTVGAVAALLGGRRFRVRRSAGEDPGHWVSAEKGYLREAGNLLFHLALLGVLISIALGGLYGYKANKLLVEGQAFSDSLPAIDEFHPGRLVTGSDLPPFWLQLDKFRASYLTQGQSIGQPSDFDARVSYSATPGGPVKQFDLRINQPLNVDSVKVYLIGHGYAPVFKVTDAHGTVVYGGDANGGAATPFIPANTGTMLSDGVVKVPDGSLGFIGVFVPTAVMLPDGTLSSLFPATDHPAVSLVGYSGNLGMNSGIPQSVYQLDTSGMTKLAGSPRLMVPGQTWTLPGGKGKITFVGVKQWVSITITHDPGQLPALICGILALAGLLLSFIVRRRRVFVRAAPAASGTGSEVTIGGLTRSDATGGFEDEFASLAAEIAAVTAVTTAGTGEHSPAKQPDSGA